MSALTGSQIALSAASTVSQYTAQQQAATEAQRQGAYEASIYNTDASLADAQAADAIAKGQTAALRLGTQTRQLIGSQRAAMAAQGVALSSGSALDVQDNSENLGALDALTIKNNARLRAFGYETQALDFRNRAGLSLFAGQNTAAADRSRSLNTLIGGASEAYGIYQRGQDKTSMDA